MGQENPRRSNWRKLESKGANGHHGQTTVAPIVHGVPMDRHGGPLPIFCPVFFAVQALPTIIFTIKASFLRLL